MVRSVVSNVRPIRGSASGAIRCLRLILGGNGISGSIAQTPIPATAAIAATNAIVQRQSPKLPMSCPNRRAQRSRPG